MRSKCYKTHKSIHIRWIMSMRTALLDIIFGLEQKQVCYKCLSLSYIYLFIYIYIYI